MKIAKADPVPTSANLLDESTTFAEWVRDTPICQPASLSPVGIRVILPLIGAHAAPVPCAGCRSAPSSTSDAGRGGTYPRRSGSSAVRSTSGSGAPWVRSAGPRRRGRWWPAARCRSRSRPSRRRRSGPMARVSGGPAAALLMVARSRGAGRSLRMRSSGGVSVSTGSGRPTRPRRPGRAVPRNGGTPPGHRWSPAPGTRPRGRTSTRPRCASAAAAPDVRRNLCN